MQARNKEAADGQEQCDRGDGEAVRAALDDGGCTTSACGMRWQRALGGRVRPRAWAEASAAELVAEAAGRVGWVGPRRRRRHAAGAVRARHRAGVARSSELERRLAQMLGRGRKSEGVSSARLRLLLGELTAEGEASLNAANEKLRAASGIDAPKPDEDEQPKVAPRRKQRARIPWGQQALLVVCRSRSPGLSQGARAGSVPPGTRRAAPAPGPGRA
jgi:hypothetical protein